MSAVKRSEPTRLSRRQRAEATHWRIVKAAYTLFCEQGYAGTTMAQIAQAAGVAVQTVYFVFHTKAALLGRAYEFAVKGEHEPLIPQQQAWHAAMAAEPEVTQALRHLVTGVGEIMRRVTPLYLVARGEPLAGGQPVNLTKGDGAKQEIVYRYTRLVPPGSAGNAASQGIDLTKPITLA